MFYIPSVLKLQAPKEQGLPVIYDSPHSGHEWPNDFETDLPRTLLRQMTDPFVDMLFNEAPYHKSYFLQALFPRFYIDPNRAREDIDPSLLADNEEGLALKPGEKSRLGHGLIWRLCPPDHVIYKNPLPSKVISARIDSCWQPYHDQLRSLYDRLHRRFGFVLHINCHSMPSRAVKKNIDIVIGDRSGRSCGSEYSTYIGDFFKRAGFEVRFNAPYRGAWLISAYSAPEKHRHSLQIEINRALYMDEKNYRRHKGFDVLKTHITQLQAELALYMKETLSKADLSSRRAI